MPDEKPNLLGPAQERQNALSRAGTTRGVRDPKVLKKAQLSLTYPRSLR
jgi:hypothetical protein